MNKLLLAALSFAAFGAHAADQGFYAGANFGSLNLEVYNPDESVRRSLHVSSLEGVGGFQFHKYMKVEARVGVGIDDQRETTRAFGVGPGVESDTKNPGFLTTTYNDAKVFQTTMQVNYYASVYFRPELANDRAKLYGLLGFTQMDIAVERFTGDTVIDIVTNTDEDGAIVSIDSTDTIDVATFDGDIDDSGLSLGIGVGFFVTEEVVVNVEWKNFIQGTDDITGFNSNGFTIGFDMQF